MTTSTFMSLCSNYERTSGSDLTWSHNQNKKCSWRECVRHTVVQCVSFIIYKCMIEFVATFRIQHSEFNIHPLLCSDLSVFACLISFLVPDIFSFQICHHSRYPSLQMSRKSLCHWCNFNKCSLNNVQWWKCTLKNDEKIGHWHAVFYLVLIETGKQSTDFWPFVI